MALSKSDSTFRLDAIRFGAKDIALFELVPSNQAPLPSVSAGSHIDVHLGNGMVRQYSLITPLCDAERYTIAVKHEASGRGGSDWLHQKHKVGDYLELGEPRNLFPLSVADTPVVLLAGGIGITPIYAMYHELKAAGRKVSLHYWCRTPEQALFYDEMVMEEDINLHLPSTTRPSVAAVALAAAAESEIYCCGPASMVDELETLTTQLGESRVFVERFQAAPTATMTDSSSSNEFSVVLAQSQREITVGADQTILEALLDADIDVMYSCEQGICGACEQKVIDGSPEHRDSVSSAEKHDADNTMIICCSRSRSAKLVLDL